MTAIERHLAASFHAVFNGKPSGDLLSLSVSKETRVPDNDERGRALRSRLPSPTYNAHEWPHCQRYAMQETIDGRYETTDV